MNNEKRTVYSLDDEFYNYEDEWEVVEAAKDNEQTIYYQGEVKPVLPKHLIDANDIIEMLAERAYDVAGEIAEDYATDVSNKAGKELDAFLYKWIEKYAPIYFYQVENVQCIVIEGEEND